MQTPVSYAITLLLALFIACTPNGGSAVAQISPYEAGNPLENFLWMFGVKQPAREKRLEEVRDGARILKEYERAVNGLREGDEREFRRGRAYLLAVVPSPSLSEKNQELAARLYRSLPRKFEQGYAFHRDDGTVAKDPDEFVRQRLAREQHSVFGGDGSGGGDAD